METQTVTLFLAGFITGILLNYFVGRFILANVFSRKVAGKITVKTVTYYEMVQHFLTYGLGFALGGMFLSKSAFSVLLLGWFAAQVLLATFIFGFSKLEHSIAFTGVDTASDVLLGVAFGSGTTLTLIRMGLLHVV